MVMPLAAALSALFLNSASVMPRPVLEKSDATGNADVKTSWMALEQPLAALYAGPGRLLKIDGETEKALGKIFYYLQQAGISVRELEPLILRDFGDAAGKSLLELLGCYEFYKSREAELLRSVDVGIILDLRAVQKQLFGAKVADPLFSFYRDFVESLPAEEIKVISGHRDNPAVNEGCVAVQTWELP